MNNEEKILSLLETIVAGQSAVQADITGLKDGQAKLEANQAKLEANQAKLEANQAKLETNQAELKEIMVRFESELNQKVDVLFDSYSLVYDVLKEVRCDVAELKSDRDIHDLHIKHLENWKKAQ